MRGRKKKSVRRELWVEVRRLSFYLDAGLDLLSALKGLGGVWEGVRERILDGSTLRDALSGGGKAFPMGFALRVGAAQDNGCLVEELSKIGMELEQAQNWRRKLMGVMLYPCIVILLTVVLCVLLWIWWLPKLDEMLAEPALSQAPVGGSGRGSAVGGHWLLWAGSLLSGVSAVWWIRTRLTGGRLERTSLLQQCRTARMLAGLLQAGLVLPTALRETAGLVRRPQARERWMEGIARIEAGESFSKVAVECNWWSADYAGMLSTGEQTGRTAEVLEDMAAWLEEEIERKCQRLLVLTEPALLIVIAGIVLWMVSRFVEPMLQMLETSGL